MLKGTGLPVVTETFVDTEQFNRINNYYPALCFIPDRAFVDNKIYIRYARKIQILVKNWIMLENGRNS